MSKPAIAFVIFKPSEFLFPRLELALSADWEVFVYDNSPTDSMARDFCSTRECTHYFTAGKNVGLGVAISTLAAQAHYAGYATLLFFDQDTGFTIDTLSFVQRFVAANVPLSERYGSIVFNAKEYKGGSDKQSFVCRDVLLSINSGSLYFLENVRKADWFDHTFFVDCVDYEFCFRSACAGLKTAACLNTPGFDHDTEQADRTYHLFGKPLRLRSYPLWRVCDAMSGYFKLCFRSLKALNGVYVWAFIKSMTGYFFWQIVVRILDLRRKVLRCSG